MDQMVIIARKDEETVKITDNLASQQAMVRQRLAQGLTTGKAPRPAISG
ncbi:MAG: hypothetical protein R3F54_17675 [Alphaproteobacteria bacterium]